MVTLATKENSTHQEPLCESEVHKLKTGIELDTGLLKCRNQVYF